MMRTQRERRVLYADDAVLIANSREEHLHTADEFGRVCDRLRLVINVDKSKVLVVKLDQRPNVVKVKMSEEELEEVMELKYVRVRIVT